VDMFGYASHSKQRHDELVGSRHEEANSTKSPTSKPPWDPTNDQSISTASLYAENLRV
jgi:hypothetical protein